MSRNFVIDGESFKLDGQDFRVLSGALHYFRVHPSQWAHRLRMLHAMGLNTVETYVPWNLHEPRPGEFRDLELLGAFLDAAADEGLLAIVRPGPYICAEWENGGLPWWLTDVRLRTSDPGYLRYVDRFFAELIPSVAERQITRGGNVIMVQVENEYGSYGTDQAYLRHLADELIAHGIEVPLFTSDGPGDWWLTGGTVPGLLATVNFGSEPERAFETLKRHRPGEPLFCMEFWCGWFDHWAGEHITREPADAADSLERMLAMGASVNIYMAHGGTSFGSWSGANRHEAYHATVSSYDYDAPIAENGAPTEKFWLFRDILRRYNPDVPEVPQAPAALPPSAVALTGSVRLSDAGTGIRSASPFPPTFEELGLEHGLVSYRTRVPGPREPYKLVVDGLHDRAHVFVDGELRAVFSRDADDTLEIPGPAEIELLVESMGRTNFGPHLGERKGILRGVRHHQQFLHDWEVTAYPLTVPGGFGEVVAEPRRFFRGEFEVAEPGDTFVELPGWGKGYVWVNGFCLGRYWERGPQRRLYVPAPLLREGANEIVVLELDQVGPLEVKLEQ
ncbi:beta-galactosidase family protein [Nonomuraea sp. NPDC050663]|uniref:beta-galactosidase family protein n=1 Tax=Nonomuraea sp. NPDC050663 TaxID=3364370 RepID=UPI003798BE2E